MTAPSPSKSQILEKFIEREGITKNTLPEYPHHELYCVKHKHLFRAKDTQFILEHIMNEHYDDDLELFSQAIYDLALSSAEEDRREHLVEKIWNEMKSKTTIEMVKVISDKDSQITTLKDERDKEFKMRIDLESKLSKVMEILDNYAPIELEEKIREALDG